MRARQELFVQEYLLDLNGKQAAIRAGYSEKSAAQQAHRLLQNKAVQKRIEQSIQKRMDSLHMQQEDILKELKYIAFGDIRKLVAWDSQGLQIQDSNSLQAEDIALIAEISESTKGGAVKIKRYDKLKALELLAKYSQKEEQEQEHPLENQELSSAAQELLAFLMRQKKEELQKSSLPHSQAQESSVYDSTSQIDSQQISQQISQQEGGHLGAALHSQAQESSAYGATSQTEDLLQGQYPWPQ